MTGGLGSRTTAPEPPEDVRLAYHMLEEAQRMMDASRWETAMLYADAALNLLKLLNTKGPVG